MISVIVPTYKPQREWLQQCLESIKAKDYKDVELIVQSDGGSGAAATRNRGLQKAKGEYVMFCDADDYMEPGAIDTLLEAMDGTDLVCGSFRKFGDFETVVSHEEKTMTPFELAQYVLKNLQEPGKYQMLSGCWAKLFRRNLIKPFPILTTAEDMAFNFQYLMNANRIRFIPNLVYHNRKHNGSLSTTFDENDKQGLFGFLGGLKYVKQFLLRFYSENEIEDALDNSKVYHSMLYFTRIHGSGCETFRRLYSC